MNTTKTLLATALLAATSAAQAGLSANLGVQSNYYFRGITQTNDGAAVSGGIDYNHDSGFYVGTWLSNVDFNSSSNESVEVDGYAGYGGDIGDTGVSYSAGVIYYWYPGAGGDQVGGDLDYSEVNGSLSWGWLTGTVNYTFYGEVSGKNKPRAFDSGDIYYSASVDPGWSYEGFAPTASIGHYSFDADGKGPGTDLNYTNWTVGVAKDAGDFGSFSVNYEQTDKSQNLATDNSPNFWIGWAKDF